MSRFRQIATAAGLVLIAGSAMASNFRAADQVYIPAAGHITQAAGSFVSDVTISNMESDAVTISVIYTPTGVGQTPQYFNNLVTLQAFERREFPDFVAAAAPNGIGRPSPAFGTLVLNACRAGADCTTGQDEFGNHPDYRNIAVFSRIYFQPVDVSRGTTGQAFPGIPWYNYVSSRATTTPSGNLGYVSINGLRQTGTSGGAAGTYRGNIGIMNASQFSTTDIRVRLYQGSNPNHIGEFVRSLGPLNHVQGNVTDLFPAVGSAPSNVNLYVKVEQISSTAVPNAPASCGSDGCPGFLAYAAVLDNVTGDATTLESIYEEPLTDSALGAIYGLGTGGKPNTRRIVGRTP